MRTPTLIARTRIITADPRRLRAATRLASPIWRRGYAREAVAALLDYGFRTLGIETIRAYTDPANAASLKVLRSCGLAYVGDIDLLKPPRNAA